MMKWTSHAVSSIVFLLLFASCNKDEIGPQQTSESTVVSGSRAVVLNEGNFNFGNASLSVIDSAGNVNNEAFADANGEPLGDVLQSAARVDDELYFVLNNSGKIVVTDLDLNKTGEISGLTSPRYFLSLPNGRAYVSDLYSDAVSIVDLNTNQMIGEIAVNGWTERMKMVDGKVFATNWDESSLIVIDPSSDEITNTIDLEAGPSGIAVDANGFLWVMCTGGLGGDDPVLFKVNPSTEEVAVVELDGEVSGFLETNPQKDSLYFASESAVFKMSINATASPSAVFINLDEILLYGLSVDPSNGNIWLLDAEDYVQNGTAHVYTPDGNFIFSETVGKLPNGALFTE